MTQKRRAEPAARPKAPEPAARPREAAPDVTWAYVAAAAALAYAAGLGSRLLLWGPAQPDPWAWTTNSNMGTDGFNWTQLSFARAGNFRDGDIKRLTAEDVRERGALYVWHTTFARSIPALVSDLGKNYTAHFAGWTREDYRRAWGEKVVSASFAPTSQFQRGRLYSNAEGRRHQSLHRQQMPFVEFLDVLHQAETADPVVEHVTISQSSHRDLADFSLPDLPPLLEDLVKPTLQVCTFPSNSRAGGVRSASERDRERRAAVQAGRNMPDELSRT